LIKSGKGILAQVNATRSCVQSERLVRARRIRSVYAGLRRRKSPAESNFASTTGKDRRLPHQEKYSASGRCIRVGNVCLDAQARYDSLRPDDACQRTCRSERDPSVHMHTRRKWAAHWPCGRLSNVSANGVRTMHVTASAFRTRSVGVRRHSGQLVTLLKFENPEPVKPKNSKT
jgi:hypothetical protein